MTALRIGFLGDSYRKRSFTRRYQHFFRNPKLAGGLLSFLCRLCKRFDEPHFAWLIFISFLAATCFFFCKNFTEDVKWIIWNMHTSLYMPCGCLHVFVGVKEEKHHCEGIAFQLPRLLSWLFFGLCNGSRQAEWVGLSDATGWCNWSLKAGPPWFEFLVIFDFFAPWYRKSRGAFCVKIA